MTHPRRIRPSPHIAFSFAMTAELCLAGAGRAAVTSEPPKPKPAMTTTPQISAASPASTTTDVNPSAPSAPVQTHYIREYRVQGAHVLPPLEVEQAVYPFLGPGRTEDDIEQARAALEKAYQDKGYQTCTVQVPEQRMRGGVVVLQVVEGKVGRLRINGARYFLPDRIKAQARSLAEGKVLNFNDVKRDIVALNQLPDRQVEPATPRPGDEPGTYDIDLNVKDKLPLHGSIELNNRYNANTTPLRVNASVSYTNLWQAGHSIGASFQIAPEREKDAETYSAYYIYRVPGVDWLSFMAQYTKQNSEVSSLGAVDSIGKGETIGGRAIFTLPPLENFYHSITVGMDYKHYASPIPLEAFSTVTGQPVGPSTGGASDATVTTAAGDVIKLNVPVSYYPVSFNYSATWITPPQVVKNDQGEVTKRVYGSTTELNTGLTVHFRGMGSTDRRLTDGQGNVTRNSEFNLNRSGADGNFVYLRGDLSRSQDLPGGFQAYAKAQGQVANQPLVSGEQYSAGGLDTVRGYLEAEELGDNAVVGTVEFRSPSLLWWLPTKENEWRVYVFGDAAYLSLRSPLPEQESRFKLASYGFGSRLRLADHLNGSLDLALPLISQTETHAHDWFLSFRVWAEF